MNKLVASPGQTFQVLKFVSRIFAIATFCLLMANAHSDDAKIWFNISAQPLESALEEFARQSNRQVTANSRVIRGIESVAVVGELTPGDALKMLLGDAGLIIIELGNGGVAIEADNGAPKESGYRLEVIPEIRVVGTKPARYQSLSSSSVTGIDASLFETARSIQVIPEQIILDQEAQDLREVLRNVSGVQARNESGGTTDSFIIRGFETVNIWRDGLQISRNSQRIQTANIEQVEVVKGPDALLSGEASPGGRINVITKLPKAEARRTLSATFDEYGRKELLLDLTGPLAGSDQLLYRLVAFTEDSDTFRETNTDANIQRDLVAPSLIWRINDRHALTAAFEYTSGELPFDEGMVVVRDAVGNFRIPDVDLRVRFGEDDDRNETESYTFRLSYAVQLSDSWQLDAHIDHHKTETESFSNLPSGGLNDIASGFFPPGTFDLFPFTTLLLANALISPATADGAAVFENGILARSPLLFDNENLRTLANLQLNGQFEIGGTRHALVTGLNYIDREFEVVGSGAFLDAVAVGAGIIPGFPVLPPGTVVPRINAINIFNPEYGQVAASLGAQTPRLDNESDSEQFGFFVQDRIDIGEKWIATLGLRYDEFDSSFDGTSFFTAIPGTSGFAFLPIPSTSSREVDQEDAVSVNAGVMYKFTEQLAAFASYSESFQPNGSSNNIVTGEQVVLDPSKGEQFEFGLKGLLWEEKLFFSLAWYDIKRTNVPFGVDPTTRVTLLDGEQESNGIELDATVQFLDGLSLIFNYAYTNEAEVTEGLNAGNRIRQTPKNSGSFWATYEFTGGPLNGLGFGGGVTRVGERFESSLNRLELDGYTLVDLTAFYYLPLPNETQIRFQVGVKNLTDEEYFTPNNGTLSLGIGQPRTVYGSIGFEF
ncbi:MAG: TonB-dependent receptor [Pseudomonadota bacterium]